LHARSRFATVPLPGVPEASERNRHRHCEPEAKQSRALFTALDCFVGFASSQ
jgi:hypothetical protein